MFKDKLILGIFKFKEYLRDYIIYYKIIDKINKFNFIRNTDKEIKKYYEKCELYLPKDSKWRHFRFFLQDGRVIKIRDQIRDVKALRKYLLKYLPTDVSYSTSTWLNPRKISYKPNNKSNISEHLFLYNDLIFDIDSEDLEISRKYAIYLIETMTKKHYKIRSIIFSGSKGFHVEIEDKYDKNKIINNPIEREQYYKNKRKQLLDELITYDKKFERIIDKSTTLNTRAIIRLPNTINSRTGYVCTEITYEQLKRPITDLLNEIILIKNVPKKRIGEDKEIKTIKNLRLFLGNKYKLHYDYNAYFISNEVSSLKNRFVVFLRYHYYLLPEVIKNIKFLQEKFNLTDFYLFKTNRKEEYFAMCLKTVQKERLKKIVKESLAVNKEIINDFKPQFLRISSKFDDNKNIVENAPIYIKIIKTEDKINYDSFVSNQHLNFLQDYGVKTYNYKKIHGNDKPSIYYDKIKNGKIFNKEKVIYNLNILK